MSVLEQLCEIHEKYENWQEAMGREDSLLYHRTLLENGAIQCATEGEIVCGYIEVWRLNFEQLGRYICTRSFSAMQEDIFTGPVAFLANTWIRPDMRNSWVYKNLKLKFMSRYSQCPFYFADRTSKRPGAPFQLHDRRKISKLEVSI